jgi:regulator of sirC expression with transglutaminase-like and TPR domain
MIGSDMTPPPKDAFSAALRKQDDVIDLAQAALLMAQCFIGPFQVGHYLSKLDAIAASLEDSIALAATDIEKIELLSDHLLNDQGFSGYEEDYYHPDNSMLNRVLETGRGIPITLSLIYIEVGQRLGLPVWGIGIPRHFIIGYGDVENAVYLDAFDGGKILNESDCFRLSGIGINHAASFKAKFLKPVPKRSILFRMLLNLKHIYLSRKDWERAYTALDLMLVVYPDQINELKDRGLLAYRLSRLHRAAFDLKRYLFLATGPEETDWVERQVDQIEAEILRLN